MEYQTFYIDLGEYNCAVHHFGQNANQPCVIMIHGSIENARIFYSKSGKGFAPWLAKEGFDVFAIDLPGKGDSRPKVSRNFHHSQSDFIIRDLPTIVASILKKNNSGKFHFVAHSWGGVIIPAFLSRNNFNVQSMVFFSCKRRIGTYSIKRLFMVDLIWNIGGKVLSYLFGYFPARIIKIGSDNEPRKFFLQTNRWVYTKQWVDAEDGFNYLEALKTKATPPTLFMTGINDLVLGHPLDVERLKNEMPNPLHEYKLLGKNFGNQADYNHINILTHFRAKEDHFKDAADWLRKFSENH